MNYTQLRTFEKPARATTWSDELNQHPHFAEVVMALIPASLILATATALLVVLI